MSASARRTPGRQSACLPEAAFEQGSVIGFKGAQAGVEQVALGNDDDVEPRGDFVATKNLSNQSFSSVSLNGSAKLLGGGNSQAPHPPVVWQDEHRAVPAVDADAPFVHLLKLGTTANPFGRPESQGYSLLTVRRLRPLARRRLSTCRPFFVLMRTRNPCVFLRWRVLG
jgi:hypothetical protein